jgi:hypothetical protein
MYALLGGGPVSKADEVIQYVRDSYIEPALKGGEKVIKIRAGDVHKALRMTNRVPSVCQALTSKRFLDQNNLVLVETQGPPSGLSTTTVFTYRLDRMGNLSRHVDDASGAGSKASQLLALRGAGKELFARLGGGEAFLKEERQRWNTTTAPLKRRKR